MNSDQSEKGLNHPDHGEITETTLDTRIHDTERVYKCERCGVMVATFDELGDYDCDDYKETRDSISEGL